MVELLIKAVDGEFEIKHECNDMYSMFMTAENYINDIEYNQYDGSVFVIKMPNHSAIAYYTNENQFKVITPELFFRIQRRNPELIQKVKSITGDNN
jgi:hypothetical protein